MEHDLLKARNKLLLCLFLQVSGLKMNLEKRVV